MVGKMKISLISTTILALLCITVQSTDNINWDDIISKVNTNDEATWKAGLNFPKDTPISYLKRLQGTILKDEHVENSNPSFLDEISDDDIPASFDARTNWPKCKSVINHIRDQGACGSCWAVAAASAFSDELCIAGKLSTDKQISAEEVLSCTIIGGCYGGFLRIAWFHIKHFGSETGGDYDSEEGCIPYSIPPCEHHIKGPRANCSSHLASTPSCPSSCTNKKYPTPLRKDRYYSKDYFQVSGEKNIQKAIMKNGPVEAGFSVYADFLTYKSGVYKHISGKLLGGHAVRIIGWGTENNTPYWLVANSWNTDWGDKGFFKILRGKDECEFEEQVFGGTY